MSSIDDIDETDKHSEDHYEDEAFHREVLDEAPVKKKTNLKIMLIPLAAVLAMGGFAYMKMSSGGENSQVPVVNSLPAKKLPIDPPVSTSVPASAPVLAPAPASAPVLNDVNSQNGNQAASNPSGQVAPVFDSPQPVKPAESMQPKLIPYQAPGAAQTQAVVGSNSSPAITTLPAQVSQAPVLGDVPPAKNVVTTAPPVRPVPAPEQVSPVIAQGVPPVANPQSVPFDPNEQLRMDIQSKKVELMNLIKVAETKGLHIQSTCVAGNGKQATLGGAVKVAATKVPQGVKSNVPVTPVKPQPAISNKAVLPSATSLRSDFIVYAVVDGRAFVSSVLEKANSTVAVGERLPDGSVVTAVTSTDSKLEVKTNKGIIVSDNSKSSVK